MRIKEFNGSLERADLLKVLLAKTVSEDYYDGEIFDLVRSFNNEYVKPTQQEIENSYQGPYRDIVLNEFKNKVDDYHLEDLLRSLVEENEDNMFKVGVDLVLMTYNQEPIFHEFLNETEYGDKK